MVVIFPDENWLNIFCRATFEEPVVILLMVQLFYVICQLLSQDGHSEYLKSGSSWTWIL